MRGVVLTGLLLYSFCVAAASSEELVKEFDFPKWSRQSDDRQFTIDVMESAAKLIESGDEDVSAVFPGLKALKLESGTELSAILPEIPVGKEQFFKSYEGLKQNLESKYVNSNPTELSDAFAKTLDFGIANGMIARIPSNEDPYQSFLRGLVLLDSQLAIQDEALGRRKPEIEYCWFPFCW